jgi:hypothetical protein
VLASEILSATRGAEGRASPGQWRSASLVLSGPATPT